MTRIKIESVFVGANTSGRPLGAGYLWVDKELFYRQRDTLAHWAREARKSGQRGRIEVRREPR